MAEDVRVGLTHMGSTPLRATAVEEALRGQPLDADTIAAAAEQAGRGHRPAGRPQRDAGVQARIWRACLTQRALATAAGG